MKVSGFTFIRNGVKYDYPIVEAIQSILPVCDEVVVCVGNSDDNTFELINNIGSPKIRIIESVWDDSLREGGKVLAVETNKAFDAAMTDSDWLFYIQGDEVVHEKYLPAIKNAMQDNLNNPEVEGLLFHYKHFWGSYDYIADSHHWYRKEIRIVRNDKSIRSYKDAQGFRKNGEKLKVKLIDAYIFHYGWVKNPYYQEEKFKSFHKLWHSDEWMKQNLAPNDPFNYNIIESLELYNDTPPAVMLARIAKMDWRIQFDPKKKKFTVKALFKYIAMKLTGEIPFEYKNYKLIK